MSYNNSHSVMIGELSNYLSRVCKNAYEQGRVDAIEYLVNNGYIKYGFDTEYLIEQMGKKVKKLKENQNNGEYSN